jgi:D-Tyr-tRNAtyr deacylase
MAKKAAPRCSTQGPARPLHEAFIAEVRGHAVPTATIRFGAMMQLGLVDDGSVTLIVESK